MGLLDALLVPLFVIFGAVPYATYWILRRMCTEEERENLRDWG